jgi:Holliday junction resolvasome RuvABC endonuclease subunit
MASSPTTLGVDQSLNGTAFCLLKGGRPELLETLSMEGCEGMSRLVAICDRADSLIVQHQPDIVVLEEPTGHARSSSLLVLVELFGCIKLQAYRRGYQPGRETLISTGKALMFQNQSSMKKFMLGDGSTQKDARYLLAVFERLKISFKDDNQADAYMHAWMAGVVRGVLRGDVPIDSLTHYQQEALISRGARRTKGLSMTKAMKLPPEEKLKLVGWQ